MAPPWEDGPVNALVAVLLAALSLPTFPGPGAVADYQLGGAYEPASQVDLVVRDRTASPAPDTYSVCYVNAFQTQPGSLRWWRSKHPELLLRDRRGKLVRDPGWRAEVLLDVRTKRKRVALSRIVGRWIDGCARKGFVAVEPDNLDAWTRSRGLTTRRQTTGYAKRLVRRAHQRGLAIAQKNTAELLGTRIGFDFAVVEECQRYRECDRFVRRYGSRVVEVEYTRSAFRSACRQRAGRHPIQLRDLDVVPRGERGYVFEHC